MLQINFEDTDLEELITTGYNRKYRKYTRNNKFMQALVIAYNYLRNAESTNDLRSIEDSGINVPAVTERNVPALAVSNVPPRLRS